ncbi:MAG: hypothetical protein I8H67_07730 [Comamonadaceae bacterium]|nr:hypothetical protein [Comamonadaceae bacterium]
MHTLTEIRGARRTGYWLWALATLLALLLGTGWAQAEEAAGQWGLRLLKTYDLPPEAVARFLQYQEKNAQAGPAAAQPGEPLAGAQAWQGSDIDLTTDGSPYTLVIKATGVALADGDAGTRLQLGWVLDGSLHKVLLPEMAQKNARGGQTVELVGASLPVTLKADRKAAPVIEFNTAHNLRLQDMRIEVWSGMRPSSPIELLMGWVPILLGVAALTFVWWARRN